MLFSVIEKYPEIRLSRQRYSEQDIKCEATGDAIKAYFAFFCKPKDIQWWVTFKDRVSAKRDGISQNGCFHILQHLFAKTHLIRKTFFDAENFVCVCWFLHYKQVVYNRLQRVEEPPWIEGVCTHSYISGRQMELQCVHYSCWHMKVFFLYPTSAKM